MSGLDGRSPIPLQKKCDTCPGMACTLWTHHLNCLRVTSGLAPVACTLAAHHLNGLRVTSGPAPVACTLVAHHLNGLRVTSGLAPVRAVSQGITSTVCA